MQGTRVECRAQILNPGEYAFTGSTWRGCCPTGLHCNLAQHKVEEHEDGTISVTPSILITSSTESWHGYLTRGVWKEC